MFTFPAFTDAKKTLYINKERFEHWKKYSQFKEIALRNTYPVSVDDSTPIFQAAHIRLFLKLLEGFLEPKPEWWDRDISDQDFLEEAEDSDDDDSESDDDEAEDSEAEDLVFNRLLRHVISKTAQ
tara:strand:+ start:3734 stop:4108 length:375 start_codon:yes stop_codon:yes gene_type:complete